MAAIVGVPRGACCAGADRAEEPARHGHGTLGALPCANAKSFPASIPKLLIKDAGKLMPDPTRRAFLRGAASLGALTFLTGCDIIDGDTAEGVLRKISHFNDGAQARAVQAEQAGADLSRKATITRPFPFNAYYDEDEAPEVDPARPTSSKSPAWSTTRSRGRSTNFTRCREVSQITRHVCVEGWSAIGSWQGARAVGFPQAHRRRHARQICLVQMRRGLHQHHRHADRAASADADDVQVRQQDPAARLRLPDEDPHSHQARLQESEIRGGDGSHQHRQRRLLGKPGLQLVQRACSAAAALTSRGFWFGAG